MWFFILRPQQQRMKQHREMVASVRRGDVVVTGGGVVGKVTRVLDDEEVMIEIADGVRIKVVRGTLADVRGKTEPAGREVSRNRDRSRSRSRDDDDNRDDDRDDDRDDGHDNADDRADDGDSRSDDDRDTKRD